MKEFRGGEPLALESDAYSDQLLPELNPPAAPFHGDCAMSIEPKVEQKPVYFPRMQPVRGRVDASGIVIEGGGEKAVRGGDRERQADGAVPEGGGVGGEGDEV